MLTKPLFLWGFMGTGKTTVGRIVAEQAGVPFIDLDAEIENRSGRSIPQLFRDHGERGFRELERALVQAHLADASPRVVALGGGSLLTRDLRLTALQSSCVITLEGRAETLWNRLAGTDSRPLLAQGNLEWARALQEDRASAYAESHGSISVEDKPPELIAAEVLELAPRDLVAVAAGTRSYCVELTTTEPPLHRVVSSINPTGVVVFTDRNVAPLIHDSLGSLQDRPCAIHVFEPGEQSKTLASIEAGWLAAQRAGLDRKGLVIGIGGGVVTDMAGFIASTWLRGVRWAASPTTLLAMVDASTGGKTGFDLGLGKNAVGTFYQPKAVLVTMARLATESERGYRSGLAEVVKSALIGDVALLHLLEDQTERILHRDPDVLLEVVRAAVRVKAAIVSRDETEQGERVLLNLGHTLGHGLEAAGGYTRWWHGEAISLGMIAALRVGVARGITPPGLEQRVRTLLHRLGLPVTLAKAEVEEALLLLEKDKKRQADTVRFVLVQEPGQTLSQPIALEELRQRLRETVA